MPKKDNHNDKIFKKAKLKSKKVINEHRNNHLKNEIQNLPYTKESKYHKNWMQEQKPKTDLRVRWGSVASQLSDLHGNDVRMLCAEKLMNVALGFEEMSDSQTGALKFFLNKMVENNSNHIPYELFEFKSRGDWDSPHVINEMASRTLIMLNQQIIGLDVAERLFVLLENKLRFVETVVLQDQLAAMEAKLATTSAVDHLGLAIASARQEQDIETMKVVDVE